MNMGSKLQEAVQIPLRTLCSHLGKKAGLAEIQQPILAKLEARATAHTGHESSLGIGCSAGLPNNSGNRVRKNGARRDRLSHGRRSGNWHCRECCGCWLEKPRLWGVQDSKGEVACMPYLAARAEAAHKNLNERSKQSLPTSRDCLAARYGPSETL